MRRKTTTLLWVGVAMIGIGIANWFTFAPTPEEREATFAPFAGRRLDGVEFRRFLRQRTAVLISGAKVHGVEGKGDGFHFDMGEQPAQYTSGTATAVGADGYYLTAAHMVEREPLTIINLDRERSRFAVARVVWKSPEHDIALVHAETEPFGVFEWTANVPSADSTLVVMGAFRGPCAGRVRSVDPSGEVDLLHHDAPTGPSDSGGAIVTPGGRLLGVHAKSHATWVLVYTHRTATGFRVDPRRLANRIEQDRRRR